MEQIKLKIKYFLSCGISVLVLVILDQWTKKQAVKYLAGRPARPLIKDVLELRYLENQGAAFGIMQDKIWLFLIITILFMIIAVYFYLKLPNTKRFLPLHIIITVLLAGAIGNFIDRLLLGYVVDFIYISLIDFPIFNTADIYVTLSGIVLFILVLFYYKDEDFAQFSLKLKKER